MPSGIYSANEFSLRQSNSMKVVKRLRHVPPLYVTPTKHAMRTPRNGETNEDMTGV